MDLLNVGLKQYVNTNKVISILPFGSQPVRRSIEEARQKGTLIYANKGRKTRTVIYLEGGYIMTCSNEPERLFERNLEEKK